MAACAGWSTTPAAPQLPEPRVDWEAADSSDRWRAARNHIAATFPDPPFADPVLVDSLRQIFRPGELTRVATLRDHDGVPRAQLALVLRRIFHGPVPVRQLEGGPRNQASLAELFGTQDQSAAVELLEGIGLQRDWDLLELRAVPAHGPLARAAREVGATVRPDVPARAIPLDSAAGIMSAGHRRELRRLARRLVESHGIVLRQLDPGDSDWPLAVEAFARWHALRWRNTSTPSAFVGNVASRLASELANPGLAGIALATVLQNRHNGVLHGVVLGLASTRAWHAWRIAYDRTLGRYSPGLQLLTGMAESARDEGREFLELGRGSEEYKQTWHCIERERVTVRWHRPTAATNAIRWLGRLTGRSGLAGWGG